jgi:hypothetical protein
VVVFLEKLWINKFRLLVYSQIFIFSILHIIKYEINLRVIQILIPNLIFAFFASYIRIKLSVYWSMIFHSFHNLSIVIFISMISIVQQQHEDERFDRRINELERKKDSLELVIKLQKGEIK